MAGNVQLPEAKSLLRFQQPQAVALERNGIIVVQIIEAEDVLALGKEALRDMKADETRYAGQQNIHGLTASSRTDHPKAVQQSYSHRPKDGIELSTDFGNDQLGFGASIPAFERPANSILRRGYR
jgi:hypothetical protein